MKVIFLTEGNLEAEVAQVFTAGSDTDMSRSSVDALSELCSPFLKEGNSAFIAAINEWSFSKRRILVTRITTAQMVQIKRKWDLITKT